MTPGGSLSVCVDACVCLHLTVNITNMFIRSSGQGQPSNCHVPSGGGHIPVNLSFPRLSLPFTINYTAIKGQSIHLCIRSHCPSSIKRYCSSYCSLSLLYPFPPCSPRLLPSAYKHATASYMLNNPSQSCIRIQLLPHFLSFSY